MKKYKKPLLISLIAIDFAITVFLFVVSIIMLVKMAQHPNNPQAAAADSSGLIKFFIEKPAVFLCACVIPLFVLLAVNIIGLVVYVRKTSTKKEPAKLEDLSDEQKEALRQELLKDLQGGAQEEKPEEAPAEQPAEEPAPEENKE